MYPKLYDKQLIDYFSDSFFYVTSTFSAPPKDELSIAINAEFDTINPVVNTMMAGVMVDDAVIRPVTKLTPAGPPNSFICRRKNHL